MPIFPIDQICSPGETVTLPKKEFRHLTTVLRKKEGDVITVMDTSGGRYEARLIRDGSALGVVIEKGLPPIPDPYPIHLYLSLLKRDKIAWVIQKSVELNIEAVHLVTTERSVRQELSAAHVKRLSRIAKEAQKQCGRIRPLTIHEPMRIRESLFIPPPLRGGVSGETSARRQKANRALFPDARSATELAEGEGEAHIFFDEDSGGKTLKQVFAEPACLTPPFGLWIGPEGGWTKEEISFARQNGFHLARLGPLTLRAETAALCAISSVMILCDLPVVGAPSPRNRPSAC